MYNRKTNDKLSTANVPAVPLADQVDECPPHFWFLADGWQECKKCNTRSKIMRYEASDGWSPRNPIKKAAAEATTKETTEATTKATTEAITEAITEATD